MAAYDDTASSASSDSAGIPGHASRGHGAHVRGPRFNRRSTPALALRVVDFALTGTQREREHIARVAARSLEWALDEERADAVDTLRVAKRQLGLSRAPSQPRYRAWISTRPQSEDWPSDYAIAKAFGGSFSAARCAADGMVWPDPEVKGMRQLGTPPTPDGLREGLREYLASRECDPERVQARFFEYARARIAEDPSNAARFAISCVTYIRHFGSWMHALADVGGLDDISFETYLRLSRALKKRQRHGRNVDRTAELEAERRECRATLQDYDEWAREEGVPILRQTFDEYRLAVLRGWFEDREPASVPSADTIVSLYGSFPDALRDAGVISEDEARRRRFRRGEDMPPALVAWWVREALEELKDGISERAYGAWRRTEGPRRGCCIPSPVTVVSKLNASDFDSAVGEALLFDLTEAPPVDHEPHEGETCSRRRSDG